MSCKQEPKIDLSRDSLSEVQSQETEHTPGYSATKNAYFGNVHVHTAWSFDAYTNMSISTPDDAYRWAKGETISGGLNPEFPDLKIKVPLDFYAVSDHAEYMGVFIQMEDPNSPLSKLDIAKEVTSPDINVRARAYGKVKQEKAVGNADPRLTDTTITGSVWKQTVEIADKHYEPGKFTTFTAYEWTSSPNNLNLHRVVLFKNHDNLPSLPYSSLDSENPEDLWKWMEDQRAKGATLFAIPHNGNVSDGLMFSNVTYTNKPITKAYTEMRMRNEPLYEISQIKGTSEVHPDLSANDEFANFEIWDYTLAAIPTNPTIRKGSYIREAYKDGLKLESEGKGNPFKYGIIGDSDTHNAASTVEEDNFTGKFAFENNAEERIKGVLDTEAQNRQLREFSTGGLAGVWAEENTREAIYDAMMRKETFGTSGTRMKVRFFGSFSYENNLINDESWLAKAYANGVPMGGDLANTNTEKSPTFIIQALKEANGANLDRVQVIKGWIDEKGKTYEKIYNVALSDNRKPDAEDKIRPVGNTVDLKTATYSNSIGATMFLTIWTDPDFNATYNSFYYVRVLEIPTPRWSTYDSSRTGLPLRDDIPSTIQERAWSSPIWYNPRIK
jgi:hypothetical protein